MSDNTYEELLEKSLPGYLQRDISALVKGRAEGSSVLDCLFCELQASINSAEWDREITADVADYLRQKYLGLEG